jgi:hypothetical protein
VQSTHVSNIFPTVNASTYHIPIRLRRLATAEVAQGPGSITEHAQLAAIVDQVQQRTESAGAKNEVAALGAVTGNVSEGPDGLFADVRLVAAEELDENGDGTGLDDDLGLLGGAGGNVGQGPGSLELNQGMRGAEEFDEAAHDAGFDDALDRGVAFLGEQLSELGSGLHLLVDLLGEDAFDHLREFDIQLKLSVIGGQTKR